MKLTQSSCPSTTPHLTETIGFLCREVGVQPPQANSKGKRATKAMVSVRHNGDDSGISQITIPKVTTILEILINTNENPINKCMMPDRLSSIRRNRPRGTDIVLRP